MTSTKKQMVGTASKRIQVLFTSYGSSDYIGEPVSITEHSSQAAFFAAKEYPDDKEMIIAALLHDIGHVIGLEANLSMRMGGCGISEHEKIGQQFLTKLGFPARIAKLVGCHVNAKRYLCFKDPQYYTNLSEASKTTLGYQGGPMFEAEAKEFESDPDFEKFIKLRTFDEMAKVKDMDVEIPSFESYFPLIDSLVTVPIEWEGRYVLSDAQINSFKENSFLKVNNLLSFQDTRVCDIEQWSNEIESWPKEENKWLLHYELTSEGKKIMCRSENFVDYHKHMETLARCTINDVATQLFGEPSVLFKEKINHKLPGGAGFAAHQDTPAYIGLAEDHISVMVAIDEANIANGCLQVAAGQWVKGQVPLTETGIVQEEAEKAMTFQYVECHAGDVLFFTGYIPHRSGPNTSERSRRALFLTYNPLSQGDHHAAYYKAKHAKTNGFDGSHAISFQGDFQGIVVD